MHTSNNWTILVALAVFAAIRPGSVQAQNALTSEQIKDYSRVYRASEPNRATVEEIRLLLEVQESKVALPVREDSLMKLLKRRNLQATLTSPVLGFFQEWHDAALDATSLDHVSDDDSSATKTFGEQLGPVRTARAMAIVHLAVDEAIGTITKKYQSYDGIREGIFSKLGKREDEVTADIASINAAIVEAGYETLRKLYPRKSSILFEPMLRRHHRQLGDSDGVKLGAKIGILAADEVLARRRGDRSELPDLLAKDFDSDGFETWHQDPISKAMAAMGGNWARVKPFVITKAEAYRPKGPPAFNAPQFIKAYKQVKRLGGDPNVKTDGARRRTPTERTGKELPDHPNPADRTNETYTAIFWAYDGTPYLCAPPRLYNMIATSIALKERPINTVEEMAHYLSFINLTLADAGLSAWDAKFHFVFPRPITYLRNVDADQTLEGEHDPLWTPLGAQVSNGVSDTRNLTPPFPSYPSGHAVFGAALFKAIQYALNLPEGGIAFTFISDEFNGFNRSPGADKPRDLSPAKFKNFTDPEYDNAQSRIFMGIHWQFDATDGIKQGHDVAQAVYEGYFVPSLKP